jgi:hypothetical protein
MTDQQKLKLLNLKTITKIIIPTPFNTTEKNNFSQNEYPLSSEMDAPSRDSTFIQKNEPMNVD